MSHLIGILVGFASLLMSWIWLFATQFQIAKVQALLAPAVAFLAVCIALGQWHIARNKFKLDMFKQRSEVYEATRGAILDLMKHRTLTRDEQKQFLADTRGAPWLFDEGVRRFVDDLWDRVVDMDKLFRRSEAVQRDFEYARMTQNEESVQSARVAQDMLREKQRVHSEWCKDQINNRRVEALFKPFLKIES